MSPGHSLIVAACAPVVICAADAVQAAPLAFRYDGVLGTSAELLVGSCSRAAAQHVQMAVFGEIERLRAILSTRDPASEISAVNRGETVQSAELSELLSLYDLWSRRTSGAISVRMQALNDLWNRVCLDGRIPGQGEIAEARSRSGPLNVDALGKAYIVERAVAVARQLAPAGLLDIGGDIRAWGDVPWTIGIADPMNPAENAPLLGSFTLREGAVATSGSYARGWRIAGKRWSHVLNPRTGTPAAATVSATVVAADCVTANALATTACIDGAEALDAAPGEARGWLLVDGIGQLCSGGVLQEAGAAPATAATLWPRGFEVSVELGLKSLGGRRQHRPYVCVWVEDAEGKAVRTITLWGKERKYLRDMRYWWKATGGNSSIVRAVTRATRGPGKYTVSWDGLDDAGKALPKGTYTLHMEINREKGRHIHDSTKITCGDEPATAAIKASSDTEETRIVYGSKEKP